MTKLKRALVVAIAAWATPSAYAFNEPTLDPASIPKYVDWLVIPPVMPSTGPNQYEIEMRQFHQQILPSTGLGGLEDPFPLTTVWSYGAVGRPDTLNYPAFTIEARWSVPTTVKWINSLVDDQGNYLRHLLPVDTTLHWANPEGRECMVGTADVDCLEGPYTGPVPIVTHVHGAETFQDSDGYPEAWYLPAANDIPAGFATTGRLYDEFKASSPLGSQWAPGSSVFRYPNAQRATTLWYHDHALGITRLNVYAGPAGFYLLRGGPDGDAFVDDKTTPRRKDGVLPGPAPRGGDDAGALNTPGDDLRSSIREIPIAIQDRSFNVDGSLFYPDTREFFDAPDGFPGPYFPDPVVDELLSSIGISDVSPVWNPEFFGNAIVVNGKTWPKLEVAPALYRFRLLNGSQSRFLILQFDNPSVTIWQIGAEGGFLPAPVNLNEAVEPPLSPGQILLGPAERADVIVDFRGLTDEDSPIILRNFGPDSPFGGGVQFAGCEADPPDPDAPPLCFAPADPATTGEIMKFVINEGLYGASPTDSTATDPADLVLPQRVAYGAESVTRYLSLNEEVSDFATQLPAFDIPVAAKLGLLGFDPEASETVGIPLPWHAAITEQPARGDTEVWEIWNFTEDAHPIHIHLVQFEVLGREALDGGPSVAGSSGPLPWETGTKDTVIAYPGEITRVKARFATPGLFVWHCHILEHEDNEMMRPYCVLDANGTAPAACNVAGVAPPLSSAQ